MENDLESLTDGQLQLTAGQNLVLRQVSERLELEQRQRLKLEQEQKMKQTQRIKYGRSGPSL